MTSERGFKSERLHDSFWSYLTEAVPLENTTAVSTTKSHSPQFINHPGRNFQQTKWRL